MDLNLEYWQNNGKTFLSRLGLWLSILDPSSILSTDADIEKARCLLRTEEEHQKKEKVDNAWLLSLLFLPISAPLVVGSFMPHKGVTPSLFWHFLLQSYSVGFTHANRNATATPEKTTTVKQSLLITGTVAYSAIAGALPQIILQRLHITSSAAQAFCRSVLPIPLSACLAAFSVFIVRDEESENGIQIFDSNGNSVGVSKEAGSKAIKETAVSRAALFGTTTTVPSLLVFLLKRAKFAQRNPMIFAPFRHISTAIVLGLMIPVSFSLFPQLGKIKKEHLEKELQTLTSDGELFYHRGL